MAQVSPSSRIRRWADQGSIGCASRSAREGILYKRLRTGMDFTRITVDAQKLGGVPCIRGLRIPVATVVGMVAEGMTTAEILEAYPDLDAGDVREALQFAAEAVRERELPLASQR